MYNAHDASIGMQLSLVSRRMNREDFVKRIEIAAQGDHFDHCLLYTSNAPPESAQNAPKGLTHTAIPPVP